MVRLCEAASPGGKYSTLIFPGLKKLPGVKAVITHKDTKGIMLAPDQFILCNERVNCFADEIAAIAAVDEDTASEAAELIRVEYEPLPPLFSVKEATAEGAPILHKHLDSNLADEVNLNFGNAEKAFSQSEHIRFDEYTVHPTHSCFSEHHVVVADYSLPDKLTIWTPIQSFIFIKMNMAFNFGLKESNVRIMNLNTGGAFCGRGADEPHHYIAALLSRKTGKPVKIRCSADEEFIVFHGGGKYNFKLKTGVKNDGTLKAIEADLLLDCGAYMKKCTTQAIANAVSNAIGYPIKELPITPERVLAAISQKKKEGSINKK